MTDAGVTAAVVLGVVILIWVVALIRRDRLYVGYGVIFVGGTLAALVVIGIRPLLDAVTNASVALLPVSSLSLIAIVILILLMVYVFIQITVLSNRVTKLTQELAIRNARRPQPLDSSGASSR